MPRPRTASKEIELFEPHDKQLEVLEALEDASVKVVVVVAGRQCGKTAIAKNWVVERAVNDPGCKIYWASPTDGQMQSIYKDIVGAIYAANIIKTKRGAKGDTEIRFKNGSVILFRSGGAGDNLRGESGVNYLVLDEAAFLKKDTVEAIIKPMLSTAGKKILAISTPKGKNWLYDWYNMASTKTEYRSFKFKSTDSPYVQESFIEDQRAILSEALFNQEVMAEWIDASSIFINISEVMSLEEQDYPTPGETYYGGIDIGLESDASVFSLIDSKGNLVKQYRWHRNSSNQLMRNIEKVNADWKPRKIYIENNNQGLVFYQMLRDKMKNLQDINTSTKNKPEMINDLIFLFNTKGFAVCKNEQLRIELEGFLMEQSATGHIRFAAASNMSDDCVMSLAIARMCYKAHQRNSNYIGFF